MTDTFSAILLANFVLFQGFADTLQHAQGMPSTISGMLKAGIASEETYTLPLEASFHGTGICGHIKVTRNCSAKRVCDAASGCTASELSFDIFQSCEFTGPSGNPFLFEIWSVLHNEKRVRTDKEVSPISWELNGSKFTLDLGFELGLDTHGSFSLKQFSKQTGSSENQTDRTFYGECRVQDEIMFQ